MRRSRRCAEVKKFLGVVVLVVLAFLWGRGVGTTETVEVEVESAPKIEKEYVYRSVEVEVPIYVDRVVKAELPASCKSAIDKYELVHLDVAAIGASAGAIDTAASNVHKYAGMGDYSKLVDELNIMHDDQEVIKTEVAGIGQVYTDFGTAYESCTEALNAD